MIKKTILGSVLIIQTTIMMFLLNEDTSLLISFIANGLSLFAILYYHIIIEEDFTPSISSYIVFGYSFFLIAPIFQIYLGNFSNTFEMKPSSIETLNYFILIWNIIFLASYIWFKKLPFINAYNPNINIEQEKTISYNVNLIILILSLLFISINLDFIVDKLLYHTNGLVQYTEIKSQIVRKTLFVLPFVGLIYSHSLLKNNNKPFPEKKKLFFVFLMFIVLFFILKNPMLAKRNELGPLYISILLFVIPTFFNSNIKFISFLFSSLVIAFPISSILTHAKFGIVDILKNPGLIIDEVFSKNLFREFATINYDAFPNTLVTMKYIDENGIIIAKQLIGGILFFVPRSLWNSKPINTGELIGQYLVDNYEMGYNNLSNPLLSESLINFGFLGIVIYPMVLSLFVVFMLKWQKSNDILKNIVAIYFSIYLIFILRGDFYSSFSFFIAMIIGSYVIPKSVSYLLKINKMVIK